MPRVGGVAGVRNGSNRVVFESLRRGADFERVLKTRPCSYHGHFDLRHGDMVLTPRRQRVQAELSTGASGAVDDPVDESPEPSSGAPVAPAAPAASGGRWLGMVVAKRHARRAVTRQLIRRQIREAMRRHASRLADGVWIVRLRTGVDRAAFPSAASAALRAVVRADLDALFARAARRRPASPDARPGERGGDG